MSVIHLSEGDGEVRLPSTRLKGEQVGPGLYRQKDGVLVRSKSLLIRDDLADTLEQLAFFERRSQREVIEAMIEQYARKSPFPITRRERVLGSEVRQR